MDPRDEYDQARQRVRSSEQWAWWKSLTSTQRFFAVAAVVIVVAIIVGVAVG